jgi:hypothetical protein
MGQFTDLTGQKFERLTVIERVEQDKYVKPHWKCRCECGNECTVRSDNLWAGHSKSCGCLQRESVGNVAGSANPNFKHGHDIGGNSRTYLSWRAIGQRCSNTKHPSYINYGGRGITICERWRGKHGFENFLADMRPRPERTTLGRFGDVGNYEPGNVKWMTPAEQVANRRPDRDRGGAHKKRILEPIAA